MNINGNNKFLFAEKLYSGNGNEVHIWYYDLDHTRKDRSYLNNLLDKQELERAGKFRFEKHRKHFITGRAMLRIILARYCDCEPERIQFKYGEHGKPSIEIPEHMSGLKFSATNSDNIGAVALCRDSEIGFDLEHMRPVNDCENIASHEFTAEEYRWFIQLPEEERLQGFYKLWTCKEAYLKGKGLGLTVPLNKFHVSLSNGEPDLKWSEIDSADPQCWSLHLQTIDTRTMSCLAIEADNYDIKQMYWK